MAETLAKNLARRISGGYLPAGMRPSGEMKSRKRSPMERVNDLLAANWYGDDREGYQQATRLTDVAQTLLPPVAAAEMMYDAGGEAGRGNYGAAGITLGMVGLPMPPGVKKKIRAYHGSPHNFDKFSMDKIGTGEGAQAYGHGLYFAEGEQVAKAYRDSVKDMGSIAKANARMSELAKIMHADEAGGYRQFRSDKGRAAAAEYDAIMEQRSAISNAPGHMYEVEIDADPDSFLDWDAPLSEQPEGVKKAYGKTAQDISAAKARIAEINKHRPFNDSAEHTKLYEEYAGLLDQITQGDPRGGAIYSDLVRNNDPRQTAALREAGIPGIKYLDAGSRDPAKMKELADDLAQYKAAAKEWAATGNQEKLKIANKQIEVLEKRINSTRNYVVFDEKLISIVKKFGIAGASTLLGYDIMANADPAQARKIQKAAEVKTPIVDFDKLLRNRNQ